MATTDDPTDPALTRGVDDAPVAQAPKYLVLSEDERAKGFVRPLRRYYYHVKCSVSRDVVTRMSVDIAETYARNPKFYGGTFCVACSMHKPVGEFVWEIDGRPSDELVGS